MSQAAVESVIGRLACDEQWRARFAQDRVGFLNELVEGGLLLTSVERRALLATDWAACVAFAARLDPRIQKVDLRHEAEHAAVGACGSATVCEAPTVTIAAQPGHPATAKVVGPLTGNWVRPVLDALVSGVAVLDLSGVDRSDRSALRVLAALERYGCRYINVPVWLASWLYSERWASSSRRSSMVS